MKKKTYEEFIETVEENIARHNIEILGEYNGMQHPILVKCKNCNYEWTTTPNNLKRHGCKKCQHIKGALKRTKSNEHFLSELKNNSPNIVPLETYNGIHNKINVKCNICNRIWSVTPISLLSGNNCRYCSSKRMSMLQLKPHDVFISQVQNIHHGRISVIGKYSGDKRKIEFKCNICENIWNTTPSSILQGCGCTRCNMSFMERVVEDYLKDNNIIYEHQKRFDDLRGNHKKLSYDFYVPSHNLLIELQGEQHYKPIEYFGGDKSYKLRILYDDKKRKYAKNNGYDLLEIDYSNRNSIKNILENYLKSKARMRQ